MTSYSCDIFAEIVDAALLNTKEILRIAKSYIADGANVIDLGCMPDTKFIHLEDTIRALKSLGCKVSVDSASDKELIRGSKAGADFILSLSEGNINLLDQCNSVPILIPNSPGDMKSLDRL